MTEPQPPGDRVQALVEALDNLDTTDRRAVREVASVIRWARDQMEKEKVRKADLVKNAIVVFFSICATVIAGFILSKIK